MRAGRKDHRGTAVDPGRIYAHFRAGKTLIHGGLNLTRPKPARALARQHDRPVRPPKSEVVAFLTPGRPAGSHPQRSEPMSMSSSWRERSGGRFWPTPQVRRPGDDKDSFDSLPDPVLDLSLQPGGRAVYPAQHPASRLGPKGKRVPPRDRGSRGPAYVGRTISCQQFRTSFTAAPNSGIPPYLDDRLPWGDDLENRAADRQAPPRSTPQAVTRRAPGGTGALSVGVQAGPRSSRKMAAADGIDADTKLLAVDKRRNVSMMKLTARPKVTILGNTVRPCPKPPPPPLRSASTEVPFPGRRIPARRGPKPVAAGRPATPAPRGT